MFAQVLAMCLQRRCDSNLVVVGAESHALASRLAGGRAGGAALGVRGLLVEDGEGRRADKRAEFLVGGGVLEGACRLGGDATRHVGGAGLEDAALGGAEKECANTRERRKS